MADPDGEELLRQIRAKGVDTGLLQTCDEQATSLVKLQIDDCGVATYDIVHPCAWDRIQLETAALERVAESDAFIYGSLGCRDEISRHTLEQLLEAARFRIFDVNLRPPHYTAGRVLALMESADMIKLNDDELYELARTFGSRLNSIEQNIRFIARHTRTDRICVTLGSHGAVYLKDDTLYHHCGFRVKVADTVGSGDSFLAGLTYKLLNNVPPQESLNFACALGALVASHRGATPEIGLQEIEEFMHPA